MLEKVRQFIKGLEKYNRDLRIAVSYSGGADSGVLLYLTVKLFKEGIIAKPAVIYFNHNLRGKESEAEDRFTKEVCAGYGLECINISLDVTAYAEKKGLTTETAARELRYGNYKLLAERFDYIAQGHHAGDNAETVFFNIMRGSGLDGACGINKVRDPFIRPLLDISKCEVLDFAEKYGIRHIEDSTNAGTEFTRNKIRNMIFPLIEKELNRDIRSSLNNFSVSIIQARDFINSAVSKEVSKNLRSFKGLSVIRIKAFIELHPVIAAALLQKAIKATGCIYNPDRIKTKLIMEKISSGSNTVFQSGDISVSTNLNNVFILNSKEFENPVKITISNKAGSDLFFDLSMTRGNIRTGILRSDDIFTPFGKKKGEKAGKVLSDKKIPVPFRKHLKCLRDDDKIIYIQGAGISDTVKTSAVTSDIRYINIKNDILKKLF